MWGDFNRDGIADLAIVDAGSQTLRVLLGNGDGTFSARSAPQPLVYLTGAGIGDLNGDGLPDFGGAFDQSVSNVAGLIGNGDGTFTETQPGTESYQLPQLAVEADFKGVGYGEIAIANQQNGVTIMEPHWKGTATATVTAISPVGTGTHQVYAGFGGDANYLASTSNLVPLTAERVVTALALTASSSTSLPGQNVTLTANLDRSSAQNHAPTQTVNFFSNATNVASPALQVEAQVFAVGDFNGDGIPDLAAVTDGPYGTSIFLGNGDGTLRQSQVLQTSLLGNVISSSDGIIVGDFNGDGVDDLAITNVNDGMATSNHVAIYPGKGDGTKQTVIPRRTPLRSRTPRQQILAPIPLIVPPCPHTPRLKI